MSINIETEWSAQGSKPADTGNLVYNAGDQPVDDWDNWFNYSVYEDLQNISNKVGGNVDLSWDGTHYKLVSGTNEVIYWNTGDSLVEIPQKLRITDDLLANNDEVVWDESNGYIPQDRLQNDSLNVTAGDGLKNGGNVSLGSTTTIDVEPADFAGTFLSDDGSDNLTVNISPDLTNDGSGNIELTNDSVTVAGNTVALGGTTAVNHNDLSTISSDDHHSRYSDSEARDATSMEDTITYNMIRHEVPAGDYVVIGYVSVPAGRSLNVLNSAINPSGNSSLNIVVRNTTDSSDLYSNNSGYNSGDPLANGATGDEVEIRIDNSTSSSQNVTGHATVEVV